MRKRKTKLGWRSKKANHCQLPNIGKQKGKAKFHPTREF